MLWLLVGVVGTAIAAAAGLRLYSTVSDLASAMTSRQDAPPLAPEPAIAATAAPTATVVPTFETASPAPNAPRADLDEARREHARQVAEAERSVQIDLYGEGWCPSCRKARAWLDANAIAYTYRDTSNDVNKHTMRALNPNSTIPTIDIEGQVLVGYNPEAMRAMIRRAAEARVAKTANARTR